MTEDFGGVRGSGVSWTIGFPVSHRNLERTTIRAHTQRERDQTERNDAKKNHLISPLRKATKLT
jgi:hypothetical protein